MRTLVLILMFVCGFVVSAQGQTWKTIEIDSITNWPKESLPFYSKFVLKRIYPEYREIYGVGLTDIAKKKNHKDTVKLDTRYKYIKNGDKYELYIIVDKPLDPCKDYKFFIIEQLLPTDSLMRRYVKLFNAFECNASDSIKRNIVKEIEDYKKRDGDTQPSDLKEYKTFYDSVVKPINNCQMMGVEDRICDSITNNPIFAKMYEINSTTDIYSFETRTKFLVTPDFGLVWYGYKKNFNGLMPYLGFHAEFKPFDKNIPFRRLENKKIWHRLSCNVGITLASLGEERERKDFFAKTSLMVGLGFRLSSALRLTGGAMFYNNIDEVVDGAGVAVECKKIAATPYLGLSVDLHIGNMI